MLAVIQSITFIYDSIKLEFTLGFWDDICRLRMVICVFRIIIERFEQYLSEYSFVRYTLGQQEFVYDIEKSIIIHISVRPENYNRIVLEVIFSDGKCNLNLKKFEHQPEGYLLQIFPYSGGLGCSNPFMRSRYERVNELLPELEIKRRFESWQGFSIPHLLFELTEDGETGYALSSTKAKQTMKRVISAGEDLVFACLQAEKTSAFQDQNVQYFHASGMNNHFMLDRTFVKIILNRLRGKSKSWTRKKTAPGKIGIEEGGLMFCWINARIKSTDENFNGKVIRDVKEGYYDDVDRYEFVLPDNKWKSEQLVYEIVKQIYPNGNVWYQHRPDFLFSGKGQLSYDVYIAKIRVAIEYQGKQHFEPVDIFGGEEGFKRQMERDQIKANLSKAHGVKLVYINYWEEISVELIKKKIDEALSEVP